MNERRRIPVVPTAIVAAAIATMIGLGFWQLGRMREKEALIARHEAAAVQATRLAALPDNPLNHLYRGVTFTCSQVHAWNAISGRNARDQAGYVHVARCPEAEVVAGWSRDPSLVPGWSGGMVAGTLAPGGQAGWRVVADPPLAGL
ncbi:MAG: SURF1 family protein, partial [Alteraurantiacibacter sp.]|nr:SURF1 family protein [Alteraurantiacibacter sp.]